MRPRRGDVFWVNLAPTAGTLILKKYPAVIVSNDSCNTHGARVLVVPITNNVRAVYPGEVIVRIVKREVRVLGDQLRSVDKTRLRKKVGQLTREELASIDEALRITLDL
jgi:mRNA interferase MazF